jgi:peptidoglycan/xylan/chitin deacetylase (PgdA/CDA1 family)/dienelactone hydrolase
MKLRTIFSLILVALIYIFYIKFIHVNEVAITFDGLPGLQSESAEKQLEISEKILNALDHYKVPAVGFVNEGKLYNQGQTKEKIEILKLWIDHQQVLGNHTYSHNSLSCSDLNEFEKDVIKGSLISKKLMNDADLEYKYFRHPYLDTGSNHGKRALFEKFLKKERYIVAPVTIDTDDWKFNKQLLENPENKEEIIEAYLKHTKEKFAFYKAASKKIFGRNIKHVWLLHVNLINSLVMKGLLEMADKLDYDFVSLDQALSDETYSGLNNYYGPFGVSWLYRWDFSHGKIVDWSDDPEPHNNPFIKTKSFEFFDKTRNRKIPIETYVSSVSADKAKAGIIKLPVVIINHGYTVANTEYSFIANNLAEQGYFVASIQHDLKSDPELSKEGDLFKKRMPLWKRGVENILFLMSELKKTNHNLSMDKIILIGHSNGGDISILFASMYPELLSKVVSLDSLRMPFPTDSSVPILSLRANDTEADKGVLPKSGAKIVVLKDTKHIDMSDHGLDEVKAEIMENINNFLKDIL